MADYLSFTLAAYNFRVYKYVPFGPISEVIPYLLRRAEGKVTSLFNSRMTALLGQHV